MKRTTTIIIAILALALSACASNAQYAEPSTPAGEWYGEISGFNIEVDLWIVTIETPAVHLYINLKGPHGTGFETFEKLSTEKRGTHYRRSPGYLGYRNSETPIVILTHAQALAVYEVAVSEWAKNLAADYAKLSNNSNGFVAAILERAGVKVDLPTWAIGK